MLKKYSCTKEIVFALTLFCLVGTSTAARAQEDFEAMANMVNLMDSFFGLMDSVYDMNSNNERAALLQMHAIEEIYKEQGQHKQAVAIYEKILKTSKNSTIRNIAYHRMADVMKESGDKAGAIRVLNEALDETLKKTN